MSKKLQGLLWSLHGSEIRQDMLPVISIDTDLTHNHYWLVRGVPINPSSECFGLVVIKGHPDAMHVELRLINGINVACWDREVIETLWRLGIPVKLYDTMPEWVSERLETKAHWQPASDPQLYALTSMPSTEAASA